MTMVAAVLSGRLPRHNPCRTYYDRGTTVAVDPEAEYWTMADIAEYLGVQLKTVHTYRFRGKKGLPSGLPAEDKIYDDKPFWKPATIIGWKRPGQGVGGGRPRKDGDEQL